MCLNLIYPYKFSRSLRRVKLLTQLEPRSIFRLNKVRDERSMSETFYLSPDRFLRACILIKLSCAHRLPYFPARNAVYAWHIWAPVGSTIENMQIIIACQDVLSTAIYHYFLSSHSKVAHCALPNFCMLDDYQDTIFIKCKFI